MLYSSVDPPSDEDVLQPPQEVPHTLDGNQTQATHDTSYDCSIFLPLESLIHRDICIIPQLELEADDIRGVDVLVKHLVPYINQLISTYRTETKSRVLNEVRRCPSVLSFISNLFFSKIPPFDPVLVDDCLESPDSVGPKTPQNILDMGARLFIQDRLVALAQCGDLAKTGRDTLGENKMDRRQAWDLLVVNLFLAIKSQSRTSVDVLYVRLILDLMILTLT